MPCHHVGFAIICSRNTPKRCVTCGRPSQVLCDYPVTSNKSGTCDRPCCTQHSKRVGPNLDYCLAHANLSERSKENE